MSQCRTASVDQTDRDTQNQALQTQADGHWLLAQAEGAVRQSLAAIFGGHGRQAEQGVGLSACSARPRLLPARPDRRRCVQTYAVRHMQSDICRHVQTCTVSTGAARRRQDAGSTGAGRMQFNAQMRYLAGRHWPAAERRLPARARAGQQRGRQPAGAQWKIKISKHN